MSRITDLLAQVERRTFVGRDAELARFTEWLADDDLPAVLEIVGRGGIGKTALTRAFADHAVDQGIPVLHIDGQQIQPTASALAQALGAPTLPDAVDLLNTQQPLVLLDTFEHVAGLRRVILDDLLAHLDAAVRVVVAGRVPLVTVDADLRGYRPLVDRVALDGLNRHDAEDYLRRREVPPDDVDDLVATAGGHPLALSLAADLAGLGVDVRPVTSDGNGGSAPAWERAVRSLATQLLRDIPPGPLRRGLEFASVVRRFDPDLLAAVLGDDVAGDTWERLADLALVRPADGGLRLHDDVRLLLEQHYRASAPEQFRQDRVAALRHFTSQIDQAPPDQRGRHLVDAFFLMEEVVVSSLAFADVGVPTEVTIERATTPAAIEEAVGLEHAWHHQIVPTMGVEFGGEVYDSRDHVEWFATLLRNPHARVMIVRDQAGTPLGYSFMMPMTTTGIAPMYDDGQVGPTVRRVVAQLGGPAALPDDPDQARSWVMAQAAVIAEPREAIEATLYRDLFTVLAQSDLFVCILTRGEQAAFLGALGFALIEGSEVHGWQVGAPIIGMQLDLRERALQDWVESLIRFEMPAPPATDDAGLTVVDEADATDATWHVTVLGDFRVVRGSRDVTPSGQAAQLLKIVSAAGPIHVEQVAEELWPDALPGAGRSRLRNVLMRLRDSSGDIIMRSGDALTLSPAASTDARAFIAAARRAEEALRRQEADAILLGEDALARYEGPYLPTDPYAGWAVQRREQLRSRLLHLLDALADAYIEAGRVEGALRSLQRAIAIERHDEGRYIKAAELLEGTGRRAAAMAMARQAQQMLDELGLPLSTDLRLYLPD